MGGSPLTRMLYTPLVNPWTEAFSRVLQEAIHTASMAKPVMGWIVGMMSFVNRFEINP